MFSYPYQKEQMITPTKALMLGLLCTIWLLVGLIGHDPWKPDEAYGFGLVYHMLHSDDWLVPGLVGEPFLETPPLYYWTAAAFAKLLAPFFPLHDGARIASGFYMLITMLCMGQTGRELFGKSAGWAAVLILIGSLGLMLYAHLLVTDMALFAGCAMMIYGYALSLRRPIIAGILLGAGVGIGFMSMGFIAAVFFIFISAGLLLLPLWRTRAFYVTLATAVLCALPWLTVWPTLLYLRSPQLFVEWFWQINVGRWLAYMSGGAYPQIFYYLTMLPWFAWPALPLAIWAAWEARRKLSQVAEFQLLLISFGVMFVALSLYPSINDLCGLPMLLPLSLLASAALFTLKRGAANALDWFGIMTFALIAILLWWGWTGLLVDSPAHITHLLKEYRPDFHPIFQRNQFLMAAGVSVFWMVLVWRVGRSIRRSVINWAAGVTLLWILVVTLWMPWLDSSKSYRRMVAQLQEALPVNYHCVSGETLGEAPRAMLQYFGNIDILAKPRPECELKLVEGNRFAGHDEDRMRWKKIWEGARSGDKTEHFWLYQRIK